MGIAPPDRGRCQAALDRLLSSSEGITCAMLALRDGRPFAQCHRSPIDVGKLAAMTSSMSALGQSVLRELKSGPLDHLLIDGAEGKLVLATIPGSNGVLMLAVHAGKEVPLGFVLGQAKACVTLISAAFPKG